MRNSLGFVLGAIVSAAVLFCEFVSIKPWSILGDAVLYYAMAKDPFIFMTSEGYTGSFAGFRVLTPWLIYVLGLPTDDGFRFITVISLFFTSVVLYIFLTRCLMFNPKFSILGQILFLTTSCIMYNIANFRLVDSLSYLFLVLGLKFAWTQDNLQFSGIFALAIFNKETQFILAPIYYLINKTKRFDLKCLRKAVMLSILPVVCFSVLYLAISGSVEVPSLNIGNMTRWFTERWLSNPTKAIGLVVMSWSFLWVTAFLGYFRYCKYSRPKTLASFIVISCLFAIPYDTSRQLAYAFPAMIPLSLYTLSSWSKSRFGVLISGLLIASQIILSVWLSLNVFPK